LYGFIFKLIVPARGTGSISSRLWAHFRPGHTHDLIGYSIRFLLVLIVGLTDPQLCPDSPGRKKPLDRLVAKCPLELHYVFCGGIGSEKLTDSLRMS
jgi:hypothetical protein